MLVLTRREGETIKLGDDTTITITKIDYNQVKLGFDAPSSLLILRGELWEELSPQQRSDMLQKIQERKEK